MAVYVNQVGYLQAVTKKATIVGETSCVLKDIKGNILLEYKDIELKEDLNSGEMAAEIDFSRIGISGEYYFETPSGKSCSFKVGDKVYESLFRDSMRMFYFQRCGMELEEKYAGKFAHKACHTANVTDYETNRMLSCCGGWHDAGDYGRYVTAGAVAVGHLLYAYEYNPEAFSLDLNIPESGNGIPDILNECRYELEWLLSMQKADGGVYHKCTSMHHADFVMPEDDKLPFIVTPVSSLATADFAAVCSLASRVFASFDNDFSEKLLKAAVKAYDWLIENPDFRFDAVKQCTTGEYDDMCDADERLWAYSEIYRMLKQEDMLSSYNRILELQISATALGWSDVGGMAALCVMNAPKGIFEDTVVEYFKNSWMDEADRLVSVAQSNPYGLAFRRYNFKWGSNMGVLTNADKLFVAYKLSGDKKYFDVALAQLDYILGRNALNISYVTGHGENAFKHPHNRPTEADGIDEPIPGYVSGGPNGVPCDPAAIKMIPKGTAPMKSYVDDWGSYSMNEITIYWNSPLVFALSFL